MQRRSYINGNDNYGNGSINLPLQRTTSNDSTSASLAVDPLGSPAPTITSTPSILTTAAASTASSSPHAIPLRQSRLRRKKRSVVTRVSSQSVAVKEAASGLLSPWIVTSAVLLAITFVSVSFLSLTYLEETNERLNGNQFLAPYHVASTRKRQQQQRQPVQQLQQHEDIDQTSDNKPGLRQAQHQKQEPDEAVVPPPSRQSSITTPQNTNGVLIDMSQWNAKLPFDNPHGGVWTQGWDLQPVTVSESDPITIFVVPHSHCDPGWVKTFDQYFQQQTRNILNSVVEGLLADSRRKFIWAEISYLSWWWELQDDDRKEEFLQLLRNKQFEIVTGGWVMPDEANSELYALQVQLDEGHDWIRENLGAEFIPQYGWSIDPFGYSPTNAYMLKQHGFKGMVLQRVHYHIKKMMAQEKSLEFYWRQVWDKTGEYDILTHVMPFYSYDVPHTCGPDPSICCQFDFSRRPVGKQEKCSWKIDVQAITEDNLRERSMLLLDQYLKKAALFQSRVVLAPLGSDFLYSSPSEVKAQFTNHQMIHDHLNSNVPGVNIRFGTLSDYFGALANSTKYPLLQGSFFTYCDANTDYWSGYYTSREFDKALSRRLERVLSATESVGATKLELRPARRSLALFQHHDGITGTSKSFVVDDFAKRLYEGIELSQTILLQYLQHSYSSLFEGKLGWQACWKATAPRELPQNVCGSNASVVVYNPLSTPQSCGKTVVPGRSAVSATLPCDDFTTVSGKLEFDPQTGLLVSPFKEEWKMWKVLGGGAYLFAPDQLLNFEPDPLGYRIQQGGYLVSTPYWSRQIVEKIVPTEYGQAVVIDFIYLVHVTTDNREWLVRFSSQVQNQGTFYTDLNGFNFDTHYFRSDMPIQSQVFPMPTHASIQDTQNRFTVLSEHAQGTASLQDGSIDVFLGRRLAQDDNRGLFQAVQDTKPTKTRLRVILEPAQKLSQAANFTVTPLCQRMWDELQHPLEVFGLSQQDLQNLRH